MLEQLAVHFLPGLVAPSQLVDSTVVVIDVLRASTTMIAALAAGATEIIPCETVDEARDRCTSLNLHDVRAVLGGERGGEKIEGFDLGNSPSSYTHDTVGNRSVVFTTTNGTRALLHAAQAETVLVGAFVNLSALVERLKNASGVQILCAGSEGEISAEDTLCAGAICHELYRGIEQEIDQNDSAEIAHGFYTTYSTPAGIEEILRHGRGGRTLTRLGLEQDIFDAARRDVFSLVPRFDPEQGIVRRE